MTPARRRRLHPEAASSANGQGDMGVRPELRSIDCAHRATGRGGDTVGERSRLTGLCHTRPMCWATSSPRRRFVGRFTQASMTPATTVCPVI
jgi:hypothetical protein